MPDLITALTTKRAKLTELKKVVQRTADKQIAEFDAELHDIDLAMKVLNNVVKECLCKKCSGTGSIRRCDAAGQMEDVKCPDCWGTGVGGMNDV